MPRGPALRFLAFPNELLHHVTAVNFLLLLFKHFITEAQSLQSEAFAQRYRAANPQGGTVGPRKSPDLKVHVLFVDSPS